MKLRDRVLSFLMITFQRDGSLLLEETSLDCKIGKRIIYRLKRFTYILRRQRKSLQWWVLKVKLKEERELEDGVFPFSLPHGELFFSLISNLYLRLYCQYQHHLRFWLLNVTLFHAGKTIVLTRHTFVGKVMSLLFNMLSRLVIAFLPRSKCLLISWLELPMLVLLLKVLRNTHTHTHTHTHGPE